MKTPDNADSSAMPRLRRDLAAAVEAALAEAHAGASVRRVLHLHGRKLTIGEFVYDLDDYDRVILLGAGKAVVPMAKAVAEILKRRIGLGLIAPPDGYFSDEIKTSLGREIEIIPGEHPVPGAGSYMAGLKMLRTAKACAGKDTFVLFLLCGGASAPLACAREPLGEKGKSALVDRLVRSGATIGEINTVRRHLSPIKGGGLARALYPSDVCTIAVSDVLGNTARDIGSGPTVGDETTVEDARRVLSRYRKTLGRLPHDVIDASFSETLDPSDPIFSRCRYVLAADNATAKNAAAKKLEELGYTVSIVGEEIAGDVESACGKLHKDWIETTRAAQGRPVALVAGGETTLVVENGEGRGGRNHELALRMAEHLENDARPTVFASIGTDGLDGSSGACGAITDGTTALRAKASSLDPASALVQHDTAPFFSALGDQIPRRRTDTNVADLMIFLSQ